MGIAGVSFILVLLAVSGLVAWAGDVLGRQLGKKRVALFGLRPRRTSVLVAVLTGITITGLTILTLALTSKSVSDMLLRLDDIIRERDKAIEESNAARAYVDVLQDTIQENEQAISVQKAHIDELTTQLTTYEAELQSIQEELSSLRQEASDYRSQVNDLKSERDRLSAEYQGMVRAKEAEVAGLQRQIEQLNSQISERESRVEELNRQIEQLTAQVEQWAEGRVKVREGQQLAAFRISTNLDAASMDTQLGTQLAAIRYNYRDPVTNETVLAENEMVIPRDDFVRAIQTIRAIPAQRAIVIAYASANVLEDEPVTLRIEVTGDYKVYSPGLVIYSGTYNAPARSADPARAVMAAFMEEAKEFLVSERKLVPTGSGELIQLTIDDLVALSDRLESAGFPAEISMVALTDIYKSDFLVYGTQFTVEIRHTETTEPE